MFKQTAPSAHPCLFGTAHWKAEATIRRVLRVFDRMIDIAAALDAMPAHPRCFGMMQLAEDRPGARESSAASAERRTLRARPTGVLRGEPA
ncbi:MAG TPA: hypothetical protein VIZ64_00785 [Dokdonella sp.]